MTPKQQAFVREYLIDLNATQAAIRAGYSQHMAQHIGYQLLQKTPVQAAIQAGKSVRAEECKLTARKVLEDIEEIKRACMRTYEDPQTGALMMIDPKAALKATELEGKHLGIWLDKVDVSNKDGSLRPTVIKIISA